jgi:NAD(P)-dependent dehydrogenase (short-subunit alcohol dehydrogenase family)
MILLLFILAVIPPLLAFLYALVASLFLPFFGECPYTQYLLPHVVPRLSHLVATVAVALLLIQQQQQDEESPSDENVLRLSVLVVLNGIFSVHWIRSTRIHVVEGGPAPPLPPPLPLLSSSSSPSSSSSWLKGKVVVVTGANSGIGKETARALAARGATVVMACRSVPRAQEARSECINSIIRERQEEQSRRNQNDGPSSTTSTSRIFVEPNPNMDILSLDLSSFVSVREAAAELNRRYDKIDILINNAGIMMGKQVVSADGYELVMQANHLGHYLLTRLLLDHYRLIKTSSSSKPSSSQQQKRNDKPGGDNDKPGSSRILILSSSTYVFADRIDLEDLFCQKGKRQYSLFGQYAQSKLANVLFANELARRYGCTTQDDGQGLFVASIHPGMVHTDVVRNMPWYLYYPNNFFALLIQTLQKTPVQGAWNTLYLATATTATVAAAAAATANGCYWVNRAVQEKRPCAMDRAGAEQLWMDSAKYVGLTLEEQQPAAPRKGGEAKSER